MQRILVDVFAFLTLPITIIAVKLDDWYDIGDFGERLPHRPRIINFMWAAWFTYFWLPCSFCGKYYGGHERCYYIQTHVGGGHSVCFRCKERAEKYNAENKERIDLETQNHYSLRFFQRREE